MALIGTTNHMLIVFRKMRYNSVMFVQQMLIQSFSASEFRIFFTSTTRADVTAVAVDIVVVVGCCNRTLQLSEVHLNVKNIDRKNNTRLIQILAKTTLSKLIFF